MIRAILLISVAIAFVASFTEVDTKETEGLEQFVKNVQDRMEIPEDREEECEDAIKQEYLTDTDTLYVHPGQGGYHGAVFELPPEAGGGGVQLQQGEAQSAHSVFQTHLS